MLGEPDPLYVAARRVLLDALEALGPQRDAAILVGAQAIYLYTGAIDLPVAEYTTDADVTIDPDRLKQAPEIESALTVAGFRRGRRVGAWVTTRNVNNIPTDIDLDLMVPEAVGGPGRRAARLAGHAKEVARKARGLEATLIDKQILAIRALDPTDEREFTIAVAGPAALLVSKLHKIRERLAERALRRIDDKDALDILRLLQTIPTSDLSRSFKQLLDSTIAKETVAEAVAALEELFFRANGQAVQMAIRAAGPLVVPDQIAQSCNILAGDLLTAIRRLSSSS